MFAACIGGVEMEQGDRMIRIGRKIENVHDIAMTYLEIGNVIGVDDENGAHVLLNKQHAYLLQLTIGDIVGCVKEQIPDCNEIIIHYI